MRHMPDAARTSIDERLPILYTCVGLKPVRNATAEEIRLANEDRRNGGPGAIEVDGGKYYVLGD